MLRAGHAVALIVLALLTIGVVMVNSADMRVALVSDGGRAPEMTATSILLSKPTIYMGLALAAMTLGSLVPVRMLASGIRPADDTARALRVLALGAVAMILVCALVYVPGLSREINGARRWLRLSLPGLGDTLSVQPSEIAKWAMVGLMAWYGAARAPHLHRFWTGLVPALAVVGVVCAFIVMEDLGTGALIAAVAGVVLLAAGARLWHFMLFLPFAAGGLAYAIITSDYRMKRIMAFSDPYADPEGIGYHTIQSLVAIANGEGFGRGLGHGLQKFGYLPEARTDFMFSIICEELGIAGAALVCSLFAALAFAGMAVMRRERDPFLRLAVLGAVSTVLLQAVINLLVVTGLAPTKGIALPLLSSGGTGWILTSLCMGLVIAVDRTQPRDALDPGPMPLPA
jgi:cell division protein FtsW